MPGRRLSAAFCVAALVGLGACSDARESQPSRDAERDLKQELLRRMPSGATLLYVAVGGVGAGAVSSSDVRLAWLSDEVFERSGLKGVYWAYVASGAAVSLSAAPWSGSTFSGWYGRTCSGTGSCVVVMNGNVDVGAQFEIAPAAPRTSFTLRVDVNGFVDGQIGATASPVPPGGLEWNCTAFDKEDNVNTRRSCQATVPPGTVLSLTATPSPGTSFGGWGGGCAGAGPCVVTMDRDVSVTAMFASAQAPQPPAAYTVGGIVTGLLGGGLVLRNNAGDDLPVLIAGPFSFSARLPGGAAYAVTVAQQPTNPAQTCTVFQGAGIVAASNVSSVSVTCATETYPVAVTVSGLAGAGLVLSSSLDGGPREQLSIPGDGSYTFPTRGEAGAVYSVTVATRPSGPPQICDVIGGTGVLGGAATAVEVSCRTVISRLTVTPRNVVGSGLTFAAMGSTVTVDPHTMTAYLFFRPAGTPYDVQIVQQPVSPWQTCAAANGVGVLAEFGSFVDIDCTTNAYAVAGTISGLTGSGLVLGNVGEPNLPVAAGATTFTFGNALASGSAYDVSVVTQPTSPSQTCTVTSGTGAVAGSDVTTVGVSCTTNRYHVGGSVTGLAGNGLVLELAGERVTVPAFATSFAFGNTRASGSSYVVSVLTQPTDPWQTCAVANGSGTVVSGDVTEIAVTCTTNGYRLGGTIAGLVGSGLVLATARAPDLSVAPYSTGFTFGSALASGSAYEVSVLTQPSSPSQTCTVTNGSGTIGGGDLTSVVVSCVTNRYRIGGTLSGLAGTGLVLATPGEPSLGVAAGATTFSFADAMASGSGYAVAVTTQPTSPSQTCTVTDGAGAVGDGPVTNIAVSCSTNHYRLGGTASGLVGSGLLLATAGEPTLSVAAGSRAFEFANPLASGTEYAISIARMPANPSQSCLLRNASGSVTSGDVTDVVLSCCPAGWSSCGSTCVELGSSSTHCGACGRACGAGEFCEAGACTPLVCPNGITLLTPAQYPVGRYPGEVALGDFDRDGRLDVTVANYGPNLGTNSGVSILLGNGDGTFRSHVIHAAGAFPRAVSVGDLDNDGTLDLAVANQTDASVSILLGRGDGTFAAQTAYAVGATPYALALGDLDGDGALDLVTANMASNTVSVRLGNGDGTFLPQFVYPVGASPASVAVGDLDRDGVPDVVVGNNGAGDGTASGGSVSVLIGNGDGTLRAQSTLVVGSYPLAVAIADLDADGNADVIATARLSWSNVSVLLGNGDGTFEPQRLHSVFNGYPPSLATADLNRDGKADLVLADHYYQSYGSPTSGVSMFLGGGDGTFGGPATYPVGSSATALAVGDLNGDRLPDVVLSNNTYPGTISVVLTACSP